MIKLRHLLWFLVLFACANYLNAREQVYFQKFTSQEGLASNNVYSIMQDKQGYIWFGTSNGVSRFDGYEFRTINTITTDTSQFRIFITRFIYEDSKGIIWICTEREGLIRFDRKKNSFQRFNTENSSLISNKVYSIAEHDNNTLFVCTVSGLNIIKDDKIVKWIPLNDILVNPPQLTNVTIKSIHIDHNNLIWIGTREGQTHCFKHKANKYHLEKTFDFTKLINSQTIGGVNTICQTINKCLWFGVSYGGLWRYCPYKDTITHYNPGGQSKTIDQSFITGIVESGDNLYVSSWTDGLYYIDVKNDIIKNIRNVQSQSMGLGRNELRTVFKDREENIWIGTASDAGANMLNKQSQLFYKFRLNTTNEEADLTPQDFEIDSSGVLYTATKSGVYYSHQNSDTDKRLIISTENNPNLRIYAHTLEYDHTNSLLWIGTEGQGLIKYDIQNKVSQQYIKHNTTDSCITSNVIMDLHLDQSNKLWIGTWSGGMSFLDITTDRFSSFHVNDSVESVDVVIDIEPEGDSILWLATFGQGLIRYNKSTNTGQKYFEKPKGKYDGNGTFLQVKLFNNNLWAGTLSNGIVVLNIHDHSYTIVGNNDTVSIVAASAFETLANNTVWVGSNNGLLSINSEDFDTQFWGQSMGIVNTSFAAGASVKQPDGTLLFGGNQFSVKVDTSKNNLSDQVCTPIITNYATPLSIELYSEGIQFEQDSIVLSHAENSISFTFSALNFSQANHTTYRYKLEGFDTGWNYTSSNQRTAQYTNLPSGEYTFLVDAKIVLGNWSKTPDSIYVHITPAFWEQWWFFALLLLSFVYLFTLFSKQKAKKFEQSRVKLETIIKQRTNQITQQNEEITSQRDSILKQKIKIEQAHYNTTSSIEYAKQIQEAMLPSWDIVNNNYSESFILYQPRDIVSGDFYWMREAQDGAIAIAVADCTGHGVPGAFLSILGISLLNDITNEKKFTSASAILDQLRTQLIKSLKQRYTLNSTKDGMDISLCIINPKDQTITYAGAHNPIYLISEDGKLDEYKADKMPIGSFIIESPFTDHTISYNKNTMLYMFSDGYHDQFGGTKGKKLKTKGFKTILQNIADLPADEQRIYLRDFLYLRVNPGKKKYEQIDDITIMGLRL